MSLVFLRWTETRSVFPSGALKIPGWPRLVRVLVVPAVDGCPVAVLACPGPRRPCGVCLAYLVLTYLLTYLLTMPGSARDRRQQPQ